MSKPGHTARVERERNGPSARTPQRAGVAPEHAAAASQRAAATVAGSEAPQQQMQAMAPGQRAAAMRGLNTAVGNHQAARVATAPAASRPGERPTEHLGTGTSEREADALADAIPHPRAPAVPRDDEPRGGGVAAPFTAGRTLLRWRSEAFVGGELGASAEQRALVPRTGGAPLPNTLRQALEAEMDCDLGEVRLHTDDSAATLARDLGARAFTVGTAISFARGEFAPHTSAGLSLLIHEVKHVEQGLRGLRPGMFLPGHAIAAPDDPLEVEATTTAQRIVASGLRPAPVVEPAPRPSRRHRRSTVAAPGAIFRAQVTGSTNPNYQVGQIRHIRKATTLPVGYVELNDKGAPKGRPNALGGANTIPVHTRVEVKSAQGEAIEVEVEDTDDFGKEQPYAGKKGVIHSSYVTNPQQESARSKESPAAATTPAAAAKPKVAPTAAPASAGKVAAPPAGGALDPLKDPEVDDIRHTKGSSELPIAIGSAENRLGGRTQLPVHSKVRIIAVYRYPQLKTVIYKVKVLESGDPAVKIGADTEGVLRSVVVNSKEEEAKRDAESKQVQGDAADGKAAAGDGKAAGPAEPVLKTRRIKIFTDTTIFMRALWRAGQPNPGSDLPPGEKLGVGELVRLVGEPQPGAPGQVWQSIVVLDVDEAGRPQKHKGVKGIIRVENLTTLAEELELRRKAAALAAPEMPEPDKVDEIANAPGFPDYYKALLELLQARDYRGFFTRLDGAPMNYIVHALNRLRTEESGLQKLGELVSALKDPANRGGYFYERVHAALFIVHLTFSPKDRTLTRAEGDTIVLEVAKIGWKDQIEFLKNRLLLAKDENPGTLELLYRLRGESMPRQSEPDRTQFISAEPQGVIPRGTRVDYLYVDRGDFRPEYYTWYITKVGRSFDDWSRFARINEIHLKHFRHVWDEDPGHYVVNVFVQSRLPESQQGHFPGFKLTYDQEVVAETDDRGILGQAHAEGSAAMSFTELQESRKLAAQQVLEMGTPKDQRDPANPERPYVALLRGDNPSKALGDFNSYQLMGAHEDATTFHWFVTSRDMNAEHPLARAFRFGTVENVPVVFLDHNHDIVEVPLKKEEVLEIYCQQLNAKGEILGVTRYMQTVTNYRVLDALGQQSKKILKTVAEDEQQLREAVGWQRAAVPLKATHLDGRTGVLRTSLRLYMDLKSTTYYLDRHQSMTGRQIVVPEFRIIDLEHPTQEPYTGETVEEAIADFKGNNKFVKGRMRITVPPIDGWIDRQKFPNGAMWDFETTGETDAEAVGKWAGGVSTGAMFLGIALMSNPLSFPLGLAVSIVGSLGGAIAAGSSVYEELRKKKPDPLRIAVDVAGIAASLVSVLRNSTRLAIEGALFYGNEKMAITLAHSAEKFTILERVAGIGSTILVQTDRLRRVIETLSKKHLSQQDMTAELKAIFWELVESDALVLVVNRLLPEHHQKLPDRTRFDYDEPGNSLVQPNPAAGAGKAPPAPVLGKPPAGEFVGPASPLWQGDLGAAGLRQRKLPAVSVREAPAGEHASVLERKGQAGPGAGPIGDTAHAHASDGAAGGPPSSLDLSFGSGGPGKRPQGPVPPRALAPGVFRSPVTEQLLLAQDVSWDHPEVRAQLDPIRKMMRLVGSDSDTGAHSPEFLPLVLSSAQAHVQQNPGQSIRLITVEIKNLAGLNTSFGTTGANQVLGGVIHQLTQPMRLALMEKGTSVTVLRLGGPRVALVVVGLADDAAIRQALGNGLKNARKYTDRVEVPVLGDPLLEARVKDMRHPKYPNDPRETGSGIQVLHSVEVDSGETVANLLARREEALVAIDAGHGAIRKRRNPGKPQVDAGETAEPPIPEVERPMGPRSKFDPRVERAPRDSDALLAAGGDAADAMPRQVVRDVTDALRQVAGDATTGLYARGVLVPTLEDAIGWRRAHPDERASVVVFDVRNLSGMTDHLGTKEADVHFRKMVDILKDAHGVELPTAKLVGVRFGGDEFGFVVVGKYTPAQLEAAVGKATRAVEAYVNSTMVTLQSSKVPVPLNTVPHRKPGKPRGTGVTGATVDIVDGATPREVLVAMDALDAAKARAKKGEPNVENIYNPYVSLDDVVQHNLATRPRDIVAEMLAPTAGLGMTDPDPRFAVGGRKAEVHNHIMGVLETEHLIAEAAHGDPEVMARRLYEFFEKNPDARGGAANSWEAVQSACRILEMANRAPDRVKWAKVSAVVRRRVGEALEAGKRTAFDHTYEARDELSNTYLDPRPRPVGNVPSGEKPPKQPFERTARDVIARLHADGIHYVEMSTSAGKLADRFPVAAMTRAHADNRARGTDVDIRFLAMFPTELFGPDADKLTAKYEKLLVDMKALLKRPDVIGFDIAGPERDRFSKTGIKRMHELMKILAEEAQRRGSDMVFRPHVGEGYEPIEGRPAGSEPHEVVAHANIDSALEAVETSDSLKRANGVGVVVRFGHATHADPTQIRRMGRLGIIAEANIGSNLATRSIPSLFSTDGEALVHPGALKPAVSNHPLLTNLYYDTPTILSTDAHGVMTTTLTAEYARAAQIIDAFKRGEILMKVEGGTLSYGQLTLDQRAKFDISRLWKWQSDYFGSVQVSDAMGGLRRKPPPQPSSAVRGVSEGSFDVEIPALPPPVRRRSPADEREERDDEDREQSAPLASPELTIIATWTKLRNFYLQRWGGFTGVSSFSAATRRLFDTSAEASVRQVMTPDELTALIKERGGARALGGSGRASQRAQAAARACDSLRQAILAIKERLVELHRAPETALPGEIPALHLKLKDLSELLGFYEKY